MEGYLAIDPGVSGALVIVNTNNKIVDHLLMPTIKVGTKNRVNAAAIGAWLTQWPGISHAYLERVHSMPKDGGAAAFTFGHSAGIVEGIVVGAGVPLTLVTPQAWKKHHGLIGTEKDAARSRAVQLYPDFRLLDLKGKGQAVSDAIMIALYGIHSQKLNTPQETPV
jgi:crossover junction endodeoxyribonuclease RuvC